MKVLPLLLLGAGVALGLDALSVKQGWRFIPVAPSTSLPHPQGSPPVYDVRRTAAPPIIDGALTDSSWAAAQWTRDFMDIQGPEHALPRLRTRVKLLWDAEYLYVGAEMEEPHLWATLTERDAIIYLDDDFEVFLDPDGDGASYFEVEINALGTVLDLFLEKPYQEGGRAQIPWNLSGLRTAVHLEGTLNDTRDEDRGWTVELAIPWLGLALPASFGPSPATEGVTASRAGHPPSPPRPGDEWRVNFSRVEWPLEIVTDDPFGIPRYRKATEPSSGNRHPEDNWVWSPQGAINMHIPEMWGVVRFMDAGSPGGAP